MNRTLLIVMVLLVCSGVHSQERKTTTWSLREAFGSLFGPIPPKQQIEVPVRSFRDHVRRQLGTKPGPDRPVEPVRFREQPFFEGSRGAELSTLVTVSVADAELGDDCIRVLFERIGDHKFPICIRFQPLLAGVPLYDAAESVVLGGPTSTFLCKVPVARLHLSNEIRRSVEVTKASLKEAGSDPSGLSLGLETLIDQSERHAPVSVDIIDFTDLTEQIEAALGLDRLPRRASGGKGAPPP